MVIFLLLNFFLVPNTSNQKGEHLFSIYCMACHENQKNLILPEKNLQRKTLEMFGVNNKQALEYQIINGKNSMPAFGAKLKQIEIEELVDYILSL
jgi:cytochrome c6